MVQVQQTGGPDRTILHRVRGEGLQIQQAGTCVLGQTRGWSHSLGGDTAVTCCAAHGQGVGCPEEGGSFGG